MQVLTDFYLFFLLAIHVFLYTANTEDINKFILCLKKITTFHKKHEYKFSKHYLLVHLELQHFVVDPVDSSSIHTIINT